MICTVVHGYKRVRLEEGRWSFGGPKDPLITKNVFRRTVTVGIWSLGVAYSYTSTAGRRDLEMLGGNGWQRRCKAAWGTEE